jgi:hypothetical protein
MLRWNIMTSCTDKQPPSARCSDSYPLADAGCNFGPNTVVGLALLLREWAGSSDGTWWGKLYVARTIFWDSNARQFRQEGCSPNYLGGLWTLTCCKHDMRAAKPFKNAVKTGRYPTVVLTLSRASALDHHQYLASAAKVTGWFDTMQDYANNLLARRDEKLLREKLSCQGSTTGLGWRLGDCHADQRGAVTAPGEPHVHAGNKSDRDLNLHGSRPPHLLLASDCFVVWERPTLRARTNEHQSRYGVTVGAESLATLLVEA